MRCHSDGRIFGQSIGHGAAVSSPHSLTNPEIYGILFCRDKFVAAMFKQLESMIAPLLYTILTTGDASSPGGSFYFFRCNPLKSQDSAKGSQGNPSIFPRFSLDLLAARSRPGCAIGPKGADSSRGGGRTAIGSPGVSLGALDQPPIVAASRLASVSKRAQFSSQRTPPASAGSNPSGGYHARHSP
jgi:hypothetical protein